MTASASAKNPFQPSLFIMVGGTAVVAVDLVVASFLQNRAEEVTSAPEIPASPDD